MTVKEMSMIHKAICNIYTTNCVKCPLHDVDGCDLINSLADWLTSEREKELMDWYHNNVNTYLNDFCKKFPEADREYIVENVCCGCIYDGCDCDGCNDFDGCADHWNSPMENDNV